MKKLFVIFFLSLLPLLGIGQGFNHQWLVGSYNYLQDPKGRVLFDSSNYTVVNENRKMVFKGTEGNISDANGNFLMSSNGVWIANANNDTMMNGSGINPNGITSSWPFALPMTANNVFLPYPGDSTKYVLFHHTATFDGFTYPANEVYYSIIDMTLDSGRGAVTSKNVIAIQDTLNWGLGVCKHANGRDWWVVAMQNNVDLIFKMLFTPSGLASVTTQSLGIPPNINGVCQLTFSQDGTKFICQLSNGGTITDHYVRILDFDRCSGDFSNPQVIDLSSGGLGFGLAFSPSGKYAYACSSNYIYQIEVDSLTTTIVATYDGFLSPGPTCCATSFWNMYLAANSKIYITSGSGVQHIHEMNYPDSSGIACDVQQHSISLGYAQLRAIPNHPNYYLGPVTGSVCDSLNLSIPEANHDFHFSISPNPSNGSIKIIYLLPQNKSGTFEVFDISGRKVYSMKLTQWSTLQMINLPELSDGLFNCVITSGNARLGRKLAVMKE